MCVVQGEAMGQRKIGAVDPRARGLLWVVALLTLDVTEAQGEEVNAGHRSVTSQSALADSEQEQSRWEFVGGGGLSGGVAWHHMGDEARLGHFIGGGGYAYVFRRSLRIGGGGATASFGPESQSHYSMSFGGLSAEWVFRIRPWFQIPLGVFLGFGSAKLDESTGAAAPPGSPPETVVLRRRKGFVFLARPMTALEFIPLRFLKISLDGWWSYTHWVVEPGWAVGGGVSLQFGTFRSHSS
jgi:hypothetical protein